MEAEDFVSSHLLWLGNKRIGSGTPKNPIEMSSRESCPYFWQFSTSYLWPSMKNRILWLLWNKRSIKREGRFYSYGVLFVLYFELVLVSVNSSCRPTRHHWPPKRRKQREVPKTVNRRPNRRVKSKDVRGFTPECVRIEFCLSLRTS